ncbi:hypothetical protein [Flavobacterium silvaticum]|uniref:C1q domain-containing protein n=1 Tax=Flavobacterium silvaticum TaxID=1852020 RepID=A0A972FL48_9FLAO|nr:hypothetical protein [Flavobacterium silvaticum]NMH27738.1 hypothetical protein [Flavobacterium silvaticum]
MMKLIFKILLLFPVVVSSQVGVNTTSPTTMLDVNGDMRIRTVPLTTSETIAKDSVLAIDKKGYVYRISSKTIVQNYLKTFVKGGFTATADQSLTLTSGTVQIPFNYEEFDENNEYVPSNATFTAKNAGIYAIGVQIKANNSVTVASNFGVAILKNNVVIARNGFANVGITILTVTVNVTPPIRSVQTLVKLNTGDTIKFNVYSDLVNAGLLSAKEDSFFTIQQVH